MELKLLTELNKLTDKLNLLDLEIERHLHSSAVPEAELLVSKREELILIITNLYQKADSLELTELSLELLNVIKNKIDIIVDNNDYLLELFLQEKQKLESSILLANRNKNKLKGYNLSSTSSVNSTLAT